MLRWALTGASGQLGRSLARTLAGRRGHRLVAAWTRGDLDLAKPSTIAAAFAALAEPPDVVVNAAAFTYVDRCETERETARAVNAVGPGALAGACAERGVRFVHLSTDYVFPGDGGRPLREDDPPAPRSVYGATKLEGEARVCAACADALVVRTCWLFGPGRNFVQAMVEQAAARRAGRDATPLRVVDDQRGSPTYSGHLAEGLVGLVEGGARGVYHLANRGVATWWDLAREALDRGGFSEIVIEPVRTSEFSRPAPRPAYSVLDVSKAEGLGVRLPPWREAVAAYLGSPESPLALMPKPQGEKE
jgi:dTDP-4-dehydrorhamnose reductase